MFERKESAPPRPKVVSVIFKAEGTGSGKVEKNDVDSGVQLIVPTDSKLTFSSFGNYLPPKIRNAFRKAHWPAPKGDIVVGVEGDKKTIVSGTEYVPGNQSPAHE